MLTEKTKFFDHLLFNMPKDLSLGKETLVVLKYVFNGAFC